MSHAAAGRPSARRASRRALSCGCASPSQSVARTNPSPPSWQTCRTPALRICPRAPTLWRCARAVPPFWTRFFLGQLRFHKSIQPDFWVIFCGWKIHDSSFPFRVEERRAQSLPASLDLSHPSLSYMLSHTNQSGLSCLGASCSSSPRICCVLLFLSDE